MDVIFLKRYKVFFVYSILSGNPLKTFSGSQYFKYCAAYNHYFKEDSSYCLDEKFSPSRQYLMSKSIIFISGKKLSMEYS